MKKGFTLIELLGVIVLLGLLAVLIVPKVSESLSEAKESVNEASASALIREAEAYYLERKTDVTPFTGCEYDFTENINTCTNFEFKGKKPEKGILYLQSNGSIGMNIKLDKKCYKKEYTSDDIEIIDYEASTCEEDTNLTNP